MLTLYRIVKNSEYKNLLSSQSSSRVVSKSFVCIKQPQSNRTDNPGVYYGYIASKKTIGNSVKRNKCKRRIRSLSSELLPLYGEESTYYIFIARKSLITENFEKLKKEMRYLLSRK